MTTPTPTEGEREATSPSGSHVGWTPPQRRVLIALLLVLCVAFAVRYACNREYVSDPPPARGPRYDEVADKIDPNTADVATLSALPMIGERRAQDIVAFRESHRTSAQQVVFKKAEDLVLIRGFGRASVETLRSYLMFPTTAPATTQSAPHPAG